MHLWELAAKWRFIHIHDCVRDAVARMDQISGGAAVDISTGIYTSFIQFAQIAASIIGHSPVFTGMSGLISGVFAQSGGTNLQASLVFKSDIFDVGIRRAHTFYVYLRRWLAVL